MIALLAPKTPTRRVLLAAAANEIGLEQRRPFTLRDVEEQDWVRLTQSQFDPIPIGERIWVVPSWHAAHRTRTHSCSNSTQASHSAPAAIRPRVCAWNGSSNRSTPDQSVLDYGCGSGHPRDPGEEVRRATR